MYDIAIIGGGPAGLAAGLYGARGGMDTVLLENMLVGGQITKTTQVDNYPGFPDGIDGFAIGTNMQKHAERFGLEIPVYAIEQESLRELLAQSPAWWGHEDKAIYDNLIFLLPPHTAEELEEALGAPHPELEWVHPCGDAVFWSFDRQKYQKTNWWPRTAQEPAREWITIRTAGTVRKLAVL